MAADPVLSLEGVSFTYRGAAEPALGDVSFTVGRGELIVVMGASGAGKSTLAKCLNGSIPQFQGGDLRGMIQILGRSTHGASVSDLAGTVGLVTQDFEAQLFATNVRQEIAFGMEQLGMPVAVMEERLTTALELVGLAGFERRDPSTLSGGEKQRLALAAVLALQPPLLVLDEPTTDLDPVGKAEVFAVLATLRRRGHTIVLIEHETEAAEHADRLLVLANGRVVVDGPPATVLRDVARLEQLAVRPLDLDQIGAALGWPARVETVEAAASRLVPVAAPAPRSAPAVVAEPLLVIEDVTYTYPSGQRALASVSLAVRPGEIVALIGQNGSGKTTLGKCLNGLIAPQQGSVRLHGTEVRTLPLVRVAREVGYVFQNPDDQIFAATVGDEVAFGLRNLGVPPAECRARAAAALTAVGLGDSASLDPFWLGKGERQRLAVASFLALAPSVLVLDEPTTGLDYREQRRLMDLLAGLHAGGLTLVIISHTPWLVAQYAHRAVLMDAGGIAFDGPVGDLFGQEALLARCHFRLPDVIRLAQRLGLGALSVPDLLAAVHREP